jgi:serine/threonine protein kinase
MGQVWRAHHVALKRDDALKVLPDAFAANPDRLARFQREAQILASLNHPNIAIIHGVEEADGMKALVMELVEGSTLAEGLAHGPLRIDQSLSIAKQVADALEAAHEKSVIHRDLKPANIKLRPDGTVKVLDFGLAKLAEAPEPPGVGGAQSHSPTTMASMSGVILGTVAYMSPEQARGDAVDKRTDIWAFGCVLYEMLTGRSAFAASTMGDTLVAVIHDEPDWTRLPKRLHPDVEKLLRRCLDKNPRTRWRDIGDVRIEIERAQGDPRELRVQGPMVQDWARRACSDCCLGNRRDRPGRCFALESAYGTCRAGDGTQRSDCGRRCVASDDTVGIRHGRYRVR